MFLRNLLKFSITLFLMQLNQLVNAINRNYFNSTCMQINMQTVQEWVSFCWKRGAWGNCYPSNSIKTYTDYWNTREHFVRVCCEHWCYRSQMCGGRTNASVFHVVSPGYPLSYPAGLRCEVAVEAASASVCGLQLNLGSFTLPCPSDRLTVADIPLCGSPSAQAPFYTPETLITFRYIIYSSRLPLS